MEQQPDDKFMFALDDEGEYVDDPYTPNFFTDVVMPIIIAIFGAAVLFYLAYLLVTLGNIIAQ